MNRIHPPYVARWGSLPLTDWFESDAGTIRNRLPIFDRVAPEAFNFGANPHDDLVVRKPDRDSPKAIPVGLVSKSYKLVQHRDLLDRFCDNAKAVSGDALPRVAVRMTPNGERVLIRMNLGRNWSFGPDGNQVALQMICRNSVDGSSALRVYLGWFRFVCANGMVVGVTLGRARMSHTETSDLDRAFSRIEEQLDTARAEKEDLSAWAHRPISLETIRPWADTTVRGRWNTLSAARVWHLCRCGQDARFVPPFKAMPPSQRAVELLGPAAGTAETARTVYDVAQTLSWVASRRSDVDEAEACQRDIGEMIRELAG